MVIFSLGGLGWELNDGLEASSSLVVHVPILIIAYSLRHTRDIRICAQTSEVSREGGGLLNGPSHLLFPRIL